MESAEITRTIDDALDGLSTEEALELAQDIAAHVDGIIAGLEDDLDQE